jgi:hypothetical protein
MCVFFFDKHHRPVQPLSRLGSSRRFHSIPCYVLVIHGMHYLADMDDGLVIRSPTYTAIQQHSFQVSTQSTHRPSPFPRLPWLTGYRLLCDRRRVFFFYHMPVFFFFFVSFVS